MEKVEQSEQNIPDQRERSEQPDQGIPGTKVLFYKVNVNGKEQIAIDAVSLKQFIELSKLRFSVLNLDPKDMTDEDKVKDYQLHAAMSLLSEIEYGVDLNLGLIPEEKDPQPEIRRREAPQPSASETKQEIDEDKTVEANLSDEEDKSEITL